MLRPDPSQRPRLESIRDNLEARLIEAQERGWLGEAGLDISAVVTGKIDVRGL